MTILQGYLYSDVAQAGTVTIAYPSGFSPDSLDKAGAKACLLSVNSSMPDGSYSLAWGGSSVVVTNLSGTWKGGVSLFISVPDVVNGQGEIVRATTDLTGGITKIAVLTQAQYDALVTAGTVDSETEYNIVAA